MREERHPSCLHLPRIDKSGTQLPLMRFNDYAVRLGTGMIPDGLPYGTGIIPNGLGAKLSHTKMEDVVGSPVAAATDPAQATNFSAYLIPSDTGVFRWDTIGYK